jgi:hypothetical protein
MAQKPWGDDMFRKDTGQGRGEKSFPSFSPFAGPDAVRNAPRDNNTISIGGQMYRAVDTGRAIKLVPFDPLYTPAERAAQAEGVVRALFMAEHPLSTVAYGALGNAPQRTRDAVLFAGGVAEGAMRGGARTPRLRPQSPLIKALREPIRIGELNAKGQATGVAASVTRAMLGTGTRANQGIRPPGFVAGDSRGHLQANQLGGSGDDDRNLVTLTQNPANSPRMSTFEDAVKRRVRAGEAIEYVVKPLYRDGLLPPSAILMTATGPRHPPVARLVRNPAGHRR